MSVQCIYRKKHGTSYSFIGYAKRILPTDILHNKKNMYSGITLNKHQVQTLIPNVSPKGFAHLDPCMFYVGDRQHYVAIGMDQYQKSQYMYNPQFAEQQRRKKYCELASMIRHMHRLHKKTKQMLHMKGGSKENEEDRMYALLYQMMNVCRFRIGSQDDAFAQSIGKKTFGIRTIQKQHVSFPSSNHMKISFIGKKGVFNQCSIRNPTLIREMKEIYQRKKKATDTIFPISYSQWQTFLKQHHVSESKMIRTYYANYLFMNAWKEHIHMQKKDIKEAITNIANELHHTPAILKKSYLSKELYQFVQQPDVSTSWIEARKHASTERLLHDFFQSYCSWSKSHHSHSKNL